MRHGNGLLMALAIALGAPAAAAGVPEAAAIDARRDRLRASERAVDGFALEGARVTALHGPRGLEKIEVEALGERGRARFDFYWRGGQLLAARERRLGYGESIAERAPPAPLVLQPLLDETVAWSGGRVQRHWRDGGLLDARGADSRARAAELAALARGLRRLDRTPASATADGCRWQCAAERDGECRRWTCD